MFIYNLFILFLFYSICDNIKIKKNITLYDTNVNNIYNIFTNKINYLFVHNRNNIRKPNFNKIFLSLKDYNTNKLDIFQKNGLEFLSTKLMINNTPKNFIIDLCSDNSILFENKKLYENIKYDEAKKIENNNENFFNFYYNENDIKENNILYLNNNKLNKKVVKIKNGNKSFNFNIIENEELNKYFDGLIGFDFFKNFNNFLLDLKNMKIKVNEDINKRNYLKINLYNYSNNIKYINIKIDNKIFKGMFDTASKYSVINTENKIIHKQNDYNSIVKIENIVKDIYNAKKDNIKDFFFITSDNQLIRQNFNTIYKTNLNYLDKDVILLGLDFITNKEILFDIQNDIVYISNETNNMDIYNEKNINGHEIITKKKTNYNELDVENECNNVLQKLRNKELSFLKITKELEDENIYLGDCKNTNDIIKKYVIKLLYGSANLKKNDKELKFNIRYNEITEFFKKLNNEEKQNMLNKLIQIIKKDKKDFEKASEILEEYVHFEINNKTYSLHKLKSCNFNKNNENSYNDEYQNLYNIYINNPEFSFEILNDFKNELSSKKINYNDCQDEKDLIKKVAHSRVYNTLNKNNKKTKNMKRNIIVRRYSNDDNNVHTQIIIRRNGFNNDDDYFDESEDDENKKRNINRSDDIFPNSIFSGIFKNFFEDNLNGDISSNQNNEDTQESEHDIFSELNNLFGFGNNMFRKKKKSVLGFKTKQPEINEQKEDELEKAIKEEKDVDIIYLLNKVEKLNDNNIKNFILQSLKNQTTRKILVDAVKKGYQNTLDECKNQNDNKGVYLLEMLKQSGIF